VCGIGYREWDEEQISQHKGKKNIGHVHKLDVKGGFTLFSCNICNMTPSFFRWLQMCEKDQLLLGVLVNENIVRLS
jgi:hypothetical protein